jgi:hypothetical protein
MAQWTIDALIERSKGIAALERGRKYLSWQELDIIYSWKLTTEQKWAKVSAIREARAAKSALRAAKREAKAPKAVVIPFRFEERVTAADVLRARGMGIELS